MLKVNARRYPTWASLARDYLAVMASSVSSERSFSSAGITISKRRNRLKEDIVEALQCLKCMYHEDLIFREVLSFDDLESHLEIIEEILSAVSKDIEGKGSSEEEGFTWDQLIPDHDDDSDHDVEIVAEE